MFAKGKIRGNGAQLARYLMTGEESERVELVDTRGLEAFGPDPAAAFAALQNVADANTQSTKPFFHGHIRLPADERLTDAQWTQTLDLMEKRLGFEGQPRIATFHHLDQNGDKHLHVGWFRIDLETMRAIDPGLYKNDLRELCREQERAYGLRQLDNERQPHDRAPAAPQNETEESRRLGTDVREIRAAILDCFEHSDSGRAFQAALEERGLMLANGDRRDCFVVIDQEGGQHALNKKLTGMKLAAIRERFADLDRSQLPGVEQAQAMQRERQAERTAQPEPAAITTKEPANENTREEPAAGPSAANENYRPDVTLQGLGQFIAAMYANPKRWEEEERRELAFNADMAVAVVFLSQAEEFSATSIQFDPWSAVYLPIPERPDIALLVDARKWVDTLVFAMDNYIEQGRPEMVRAGSSGAYDPFMASYRLDVGLGKTRAEHREQAAQRLVELDARLRPELVTIKEPTEAEAQPLLEASLAWAKLDALLQPELAATKEAGLSDGLERPRPGSAEVTQEFRSAAAQATEPQTAALETEAAPELAAAAEAAEREVEAAPMEIAEAAREGLGVFAKIAQVFLGLFGGWAMAPPKLTPAQAKQEARAEAEERPQRETAREKAEWEARLATLLDEDARHRRRQPEAGQDYDRDDDRGRERDPS